MDDDEFTTLQQKSKSIAKECKTLLDTLGDKSGANEIDDILRELSSIGKNHADALKALEMVESATNADDSDDVDLPPTQELFQNALETISQADTTKADASTEEDTSDQEDPELTINDRSLVLSQVKGIPIDPISRRNVTQPVRNKVCNHVYEHDVVMNYIAQKSGKRQRKPIKCPYFGCTNANMKASDLVQDNELRKKIADMSVAVTPNTSVVDLDL